VRIPIRRRLALLTVLGAAGGALFSPFVLANPGAESPSPFVVLAAFTFGAAAVTVLAAWVGLRWGDKAGLPMPVLRQWETGITAEAGVRKAAVVYPSAIGVAVGTVASIVARLLGVPANPGTLLVRIATTPFAAVVPEVLVHLFLMSGLVLLLKRTWLAVVLSAAVFVVLFHGNPPAGVPVVTMFVIGLNFILGMLTGWGYARWGFIAAMLTHAAAHVIVLGVN